MTYNGQQIIQSSGPIDAEIALVGESPSDIEVLKGEPFVGPAGMYLNMALRGAVLPREQLRICNLVPIQPEGNKFANHSEEVIAWGMQRLEEELSSLKNLKLVIALGDQPLQKLTGLKKISKWRGSLLHPLHWPMTELLDIEGKFIAPSATGIIQQAYPVLPTFHPSYILHTRNFPLVWWLREDFLKAKRYSTGNWNWAYEQREWFTTGDVEAFEKFVDRICSGSGGHFAALDTEQEPCWIVSAADDTEVHSFVWNEKFRPALTKLLQAENVLRAAHNLNHDYTFFEKRLNIHPAYPFVDTMGVAHILNPEMQKNLSPASSTRFTNWPYHKWMFDHDPVTYCGLDTACSADIYWGQFQEVNDRGLWSVVQFDHRMQEALLEMQWRGFPVDETARGTVEGELRQELFAMETELREFARPIIRAAAPEKGEKSKFRKPHLFFIRRNCKCCGGRSPSREHCFRCGGLRERPKRKADYANICPEGMAVVAPVDIEDFTIIQLKKMLPKCSPCSGEGKIDHCFSSFCAARLARKSIFRASIAFSTNSTVGRQ